MIYTKNFSVQKFLGIGKYLGQSGKKILIAVSLYDRMGNFFFKCLMCSEMCRLNKLNNKIIPVQDTEIQTI